MPKDSRARVHAVRAVMAETGLPYNRAAHLLDSRAGEPVAGPGPAAGAFLRVMPFVLAAAVPATADPVEVAQGLADQLHTLHRSGTGETYAGRADVFVPASPWEPEEQRPGYVSAVFLVHAWAVRPWDAEKEWEHVVTDFFTVAGEWLMSRDPAGGRPAVLPIGWVAAKAMSERARVTAHTGGEHEGLPEGWAELIAARQAEMTPADGEPRMPESEVQRLVLPGMVPSAPGGTGKTSMVWDRDGQSDLTTWVDQVSTPPSSARSLPDVPIDPRGGELRSGAEGSPLPYRVVDSRFQGWYRRSGDGLYDADSGHSRGLETTSYEDLAAARGPLRPVEPPTSEESAVVTTALAGAGRKAAASLLVAVFRLTEQDALARRTEGAQSWLIAGREGSHESASLHRLAWSVGCDLDDKPARYDAAVVAELVRVISGWVSGPDRYVEVAANLADLFSNVADAADGWSAVADRYLQRHQRVGHPDEVVEAVQLYLMSQSTTHAFE
ncbi:hypothetical protein ABT224_20380 [Streptomyces sp. NPDC001584]|uniref:hypothetical protein n=1 Tax=Streptomyces sp. NPDC001584 TaxID=3154521 RepID=UPI00332115BE